MFCSLSVASAQEAKLTTPADFLFELAPPPGWSVFEESPMPPHIAGTVLAAWQKPAAGRRALIYVTGIRREGLVRVEDLADSFAQFLGRAGIRAQRLDDTRVLDRRPGAKFTMVGPGNGQMIAALAEDVGDSVSTYMEVLLATNEWSNGQGTDCLSFVLVSPESAKNDVTYGFRHVVRQSRATGQYDPEAPRRAPTPTAGGAPETQPSPEAATTTVQPAGQAPGEAPQGSTETVAASPEAEEPKAGSAAAKQPAGEAPPATSPPAQADSSASQARGAAASSTALFGVLYRAGARVPQPLTVQFLAAEPQGPAVRWRSPGDGNTEVYVCVWQNLRSVWIIPGEDFRKLAAQAGDMLELTYSEALAPYLGKWEYLWGAGAIR